MRHALRVILVALVLVLPSCTTTKRARDVVPTGFLGSDAALLEQGGPGEAARRYVNPRADWASYRNVLLDPVTVWRDPASKRGVSAQDEQTLTNYFFDVIRGSLEKDGYRLVSSPEPETLRVKVAITQAQASNVTLDVVSTVVPQARALSSLSGLVTGKPAFVGEAQIEAKITDAQTGQLLAAGIDHRVGGKSLAAAQFSSWGEVEAMMRLWAAHGAYRLCMLAHRTGCVAPPSS
jgi:hypothetical protein